MVYIILISFFYGQGMVSSIQMMVNLLLFNWPIGTACRVKIVLILLDWLRATECFTVDKADNNDNDEAWFDPVFYSK